MSGIGGRRIIRAAISALALGLSMVTSLAGCGGTDTPATRADAGDRGSTYRLYFLGGQSNMEGFGYVSQLPAEHSGTSTRVVIFTGLTMGDNQRGGGIGVWAPLRPGHGTGFKTDGKANTPSDRFGPELTFGRTMAELDTDSRIAIIKYTMGGTGLANRVGFGNWFPDFGDGDGINQYDHALATIRNALSHGDIDGDGRQDALVPAGVVWMQGEADAYESQEVADMYEANLKRMMDLLRAALRVDDLPVVIGRITDSGMDEDGQMMPYIETVQQAQARFVNSDACAAYVTVTDDLKFSDDAWHYDTEGYIRMGEAFAEAMHALQRRCGGH